MNFVPHNEQDVKQMMEFLNISSISELFRDIDPDLCIKGQLDLPKPLSEISMTRHMNDIASSCSQVSDLNNFLGAGSYNHYIPHVVFHLTRRGEFLSSYTPYQAEMSQGMLQSIFEFQSMICELTEMEVANASMYDGATAMAEAAIMAAKLTKRNCIAVSMGVHPEYRQVLATYAWAFGMDVFETDYENGVTDLNDLENKINKKTACAIIQSPNFFGSVEDLKRIEDVVHKKDALLISCICEPMSLGILKPPGGFGADIVVGEGQALGNPLSYGGPHLGFMSTKLEHIKKIPGRISGLTVDREGESGFILTLQAREQHVRRERATSNICTNQALNALASTIYMALLGKNGFKEVAEICAQRAHYAYRQITKIQGVKAQFSAPFFNEFAINLPKSPSWVNSQLIEKRILGGFDLGRFYDELKDSMLFCVTEMNSRSEIDNLVEALSKVIL